MKEKILSALSNVDDPDLKKDIVTLGMVQDLAIEGKKVHFRLVLTTPACPMKDMIKNACLNAIHHLVDPDLEVDITIDSHVASNRRDSGNTLAGVRNIIAVASGKGGVGKSTVATNLAIALGMSGARAGLLDADIYGPSLPTMLGLRETRPEVTKHGEKLLVTPIEKYGIKAMSVGLLIDEKQALVWRGPMITTALRQLMTDVDWGELDYLVVDMPPGTGDIYLTMAQQFPLSAVVIVTTPQQVSVADTRKSIEMFRMQGLAKPILGIVENMSYFSPAELPGSKYYIFGRGGAEELSQDYELPILARLPLFQSLTEQADQGIPAVAQGNAVLKDEFMALAEKVAQQMAVLNATGQLVQQG